MNRQINLLVDYGYDQDQLDKRKGYAMNKYIRLPNGNKIKYYSFAITNALIIKFIDTDVNAIGNCIHSMSKRMNA